MASSNLVDFYKTFKGDGASVQTGRIISVGSTNCIVEVNGRNLSLVIMDSVSGLAVGKNVACLLQGGSGFIMGTISNANCGGGTTTAPSGVTTAAPTPSKPTPRREAVKYHLKPAHIYEVKTNVADTSESVLDLDKQFFKVGSSHEIVDGIGKYFKHYAFTMYSPKTIASIRDNASLTITGVQVGLIGRGSFLLKRHSLSALPKYSNVRNNACIIGNGYSHVASYYVDQSTSVTIENKKGISREDYYNAKMGGLYKEIKTEWVDIPVSWFQYLMNNKGGGFVAANADIAGWTQDKRVPFSGMPGNMTIRVTGYITS